MIYFGEVKDVDDPLKSGRVKVSVFNVHKVGNKVIPTNDLPWSTVILPTISASSNGVGYTHGLLVGSHVCGFFIDNAKQNFLVFGTYNNINNDYPSIFKDQFPQAKGYVSQTGHTLRFNDSNGEVAVSQRKGSNINFQDDGTTNVKSVGDFNNNSDGNYNNAISGNEVINTRGTSTHYSSGAKSISSDASILITAPRIDLNPDVGRVVPQFKEVSVLPPPVIVSPKNVDNLTNEHPENNIASEGIDSGENGNICYLEDSVNPYDYIQEIIDLDWNERHSSDRNPNIGALYDEIGYDSFKYGDDNAWCAVFVSAILKRCNLKYKRTMSSRAYTQYGEEIDFDNKGSDEDKMKSKLSNATKGDLLVFDRGDGLGHVGFFTGEYDEDTGKFGCLGGNQGNTLKVSYYNIKQSKMKLTNIRKLQDCKDKTNEEILLGSECSLPTELNDNDDFQMLVRNLYYEARGDSDQGIVAIAWVTLNRKNSTMFPNSIAKVVSQKNQFSWYNYGNPARNEIPKEKSAWIRCCNLAKKVLEGEYEDITNGSLFYYAKGSRTDSSFRKLFSLDITFYKEIGQHRFFKLVQRL